MVTQDELHVLDLYLQRHQLLPVLVQYSKLLLISLSFDAFSYLLVYFSEQTQLNAHFLV